MQLSTTAIPASWTNDSERREFEKPADEVFFQDPTSRIDALGRGAAAAAGLSGGVGLVCFTGYHFYAYPLFPLVIGAVGLGVVAIAVCALAHLYLKDRAVAYAREYVEGWDEKTRIGSRLLEESLEELDGDTLSAFIQGVNQAKQEEKNCFAAIDYLACCAKLNQLGTANMDFITKRNGGKKPIDEESLRSILLKMKKDGGLLSSELSSLDRRNIIWYAGLIGFKKQKEKS